MSSTSSTVAPQSADPTPPPSSRRERVAADACAGLRARAVTARQRVVIAGLALLGVLLMLYPASASWISAVQERDALSSHAQALDAFTPEQLDAELRAAEAYNRTEVTGLIVDPFSNTESQDDAIIDEAAQRYLEELTLDPNGVMSRVMIPSIGADLPIRHGTTDEVLRTGAGHLYGSSLPVGGESTHTVITAHAGLPEAELFTRLNLVEEGDTFQLETYGRLLTYQVTRIDTVEPTEIADLQVVDGKDLATLVTCTPIGVNSHRLIVQAERIPTPPAGDEGGESDALGFPLPWAPALVLLAVIAWCVLLIRWLRARRAAART